MYVPPGISLVHADVAGTIYDTNTSVAQIPIYLLKYRYGIYKYLAPVARPNHKIFIGYLKFTFPINNSWSILYTERI